ncbi:acyl-CoA dehydrogenase family protein [Actinoplanes sp. N902-109]|uniref:acyl-CoA dehydrogenase family protein n=1 Tax=Actinoplanes sp. (strain N902-109) TaxID=649831 RepID=UPI0003295855|nr:acyl-CoA dehydrogenase family protein [Actinoplanes sp. N902-109]AGL14994.1 acyl-CoA dehydrogenase [Actinoplanes sp. N902-109]
MTAVLTRWPGGADFVAAAGRWEAARAVDDAGVHAAATHGLLGAAVPERHGGAGLPLTEVVELHRTVAAHSPSLQSLLVVHSMVCQALTRWGNPELRETLLPVLARGEQVAAFALTEGDAGSNVRDLSTKLRADGDTVLVSGRKRWISFGQVADLFLVFGYGTEGGTCALVRAGTGVTARPEPPSTGLRAARLSDVTFDDAPAPAAMVVGRPGFGIPLVATSCLTLGRLLIAAAATGVAQRAVALAAEHVAGRTVGGAPLGERQLVRGALAEASIAAESAWLAVQEAARALDDARPDAGLLAARVKLLAARAAALATAHATRLHGAAALVEDHPLQRLRQAADAYQVIEGPDEVLQDLIGGDLARRSPARPVTHG